MFDIFQFVKSSALGLNLLMVIPLMGIGGILEESWCCVSRDHVCTLHAWWDNQGDILGRSSGCTWVSDFFNCWVICYTFRFLIFCLLGGGFRFFCGANFSFFEIWFFGVFWEGTNFCFVFWDWFLVLWDLIICVFWGELWFSEYDKCLSIDSLRLTQGFEFLTLTLVWVH